MVLAGQHAAVGQYGHQRRVAALVDLARAESLAVGCAQVVRDAAEPGALAVQSVGIEQIGDLGGEVLDSAVARRAVGPQVVAESVFEVGAVVGETDPLPLVR